MSAMAFSGSHKEKNTVPQQGNLVLNYLPAYATFLLENKLEDYTRSQLKFSFEENVPLLKLLAHLKEDDLLALAIESSREFLSAIAEGKATEFIEKSTADFVRNRIELIGRDQVVSEDITKITFIRRKSLRQFLKFYSTEFQDFVNIMEDVDRFIAESEAASFNAFIEIKQESIRLINQQMELRQDDLIEAQELASMGSFLWDIRSGNSTHTPGVDRIFEMSGTGKLDEFMQFVHEDDREKVQAAIEKSFREDGLYECEYRFNRSGTEKRIWSRGLVAFADGKPATMKGTIMDVTGKYKLLEKLQESEEAYKQAQALTHMGNWQLDVATKNILWSDEMYRIYGLEPQSESMTLDRYVSMIHPDDREKRIHEIEQAIQTHVARDYVLRIITPDKKTKTLKGKGEVVLDKHGQPLRLIGTCQDITTEHQLNMELQDKEEYLQELINHAPDAIIVTDAYNNIQLWNPKSEEIFGWAAADVIGKGLTDTIIPEKYRKDHREGLSRLLKSGLPKILNRNIEITAIDKKGVEFPVSFTTSESIQQGAASFISFIRDIRDDKQTKAELNAKTQQLEKLNLSLESKNNELVRINKELESFNYIASHDLQEPLRKIQTFTQLIVEKGRAALPPNTVEYFNKIMTSSARMKLLIEDLLMFSQTTANEDNFEVTDLNSVLDEVQIILSTVIEEKKAQIESEHLPEMRVIPFQLQQLFLNLVSNAIKYSAEGRPPHIRISIRTVKGSETGDAKAAQSRLYAEICVQDNGIGFEEDNAEKIFGLFQRLHNKDKYSGTGIGLAICKKIVHNHNGFIRASSKPGKGSSFYVYLPKENSAQKTNYLVN